MKKKKPFHLEGPGVHCVTYEIPLIFKNKLTSIVNDTDN